MTRPFNEQILWKGAIQRANYPKTTRKPPMNLPEINWLTGYPMNQPNHSKEMNVAYAAYSRQYWLGVEERKQAYRKRMVN